MTEGPRRRGRPAKSAEREPLTRELVGRAALRIAGDEGFPRLTMRRLAAEIGVTVRALYHVVADRQDVVDLAAAQLIELLPEHDFDLADWRGTVRRMYAEARAVYRTVPRATLISLDETLTPSEVPVGRVLAPERMLAFLVAIGLELEQALIVRAQFLVEVFGFVLLVDYRYDRSDGQVRAMMAQPVPAIWLDAHPEVAAPLSRAAAALPPSSPDALFETLAQRAVATIEAMLVSRS